MSSGKVLETSLLLSILTTSGVIANGLMAVVAARSLGAEGRGVMVIAITLVALTALLASLRTNTAGRYFLVNRERTVELSSYFGLTCALALLELLLLVRRSG